MGRDRSEGWRHAKRSGHSYEDQFCLAINSGHASPLKLGLVEICARLGLLGEPTACIGTGRLQVRSLWGSPVQGKCDAIVEFGGTSSVGVSVKQPTAVEGQVHLTTLERFLDWAEMRSRSYTDQVGAALALFTGNTAGVPITAFVPRDRLGSPRLSKHGGELAEVYQNRLYASTISREMPAIWRALVGWLDLNITLLTSMCFGEGYCADSGGHAQVLHYGHGVRFFLIADLARAAYPARVVPTAGGAYPGSTVQLPWGSLQVHRPGRSEGAYQLQFRHSLVKIGSLLESSW